MHVRSPVETPIPESQTTEAEERARRRRTQVRRRRAVALSVLVAMVAAAVAVPLALRGGGAQADVVTDRTTTSGAASTSTTPVSSTSPISTSTTIVAAEQEVTRAFARELGANELGLVPVLMYHKIGNDIVPPARLRDDIARLKAAGFYPTTIREMVEGTMDIPAGKSPVVLTFDDSSPTHYRYLEDGSLDPDCAVAILLHEVSRGDWAPKACFFPLLDVDSAANIVFGQPEYAERKLQNLVALGFEVGSHTMTHRDLSVATPEQIHRELAQSEAQLEAMIGGGYQIYTLNPPFGEYPDDVSLLTSGEYEGVSYEFSAVLLAAGGRGFSPFSTEFDPLRIRRITAYPTETVPNLVAYFEKHPEMRFVSDGDAGVVSAPTDVPEELGEVRRVVPKRVVRY
jgi:peptidoglycan/xylan/chitin deacetylase (PgdA/CDA1 family)